MTRAHGIDISKWQVSFDPTRNPDDTDFVVIRASYGTRTDEKYDAFLEAIKPIPIRGAYHYFQSAPAWKDQAEHFLSLVEDKDLHFYVLDFETTGNERTRKFSSNGEKWMQHVADETDKKVVLYTNPNVYKTWLRPFGDWMRDWPLWIAQYFFEPDRNRTPALSAGADDWKIWQYSADAPPNEKGSEYGVESRNIDLDVYNGTVGQMREWLGIGGEPPEEKALVQLDSIVKWARDEGHAESLLEWAKEYGFKPT